MTYLDALADTLTTIADTLPWVGFVLAGLTAFFACVVLLVSFFDWLNNPHGHVPWLSCLLFGPVNLVLVVIPVGQMLGAWT